ncbi:MAG: translocation/assembly module TamB domain-containing protein [Alphaproteobacteria bacterium]
MIILAENILSILKRMFFYSLVKRFSFIKYITLSILFVCLVFSALQIQKVKCFILGRTILYAINEPTHHVYIEKIEGLFPFCFSIPKIVFSDYEGEWLALENFSFKITPFLKLKKISVKNVIYKKSPIFKTPISIPWKTLLFYTLSQKGVTLNIEQVLLKHQKKSLIFNFYFGEDDKKQTFFFIDKFDHIHNEKSTILHTYISKKGTKEVLLRGSVLPYGVGKINFESTLKYSQNYMDINGKVNYGNKPFFTDFIDSNLLFTFKVPLNHLKVPFTFSLINENDVALNGQLNFKENAFDGRYNISFPYYFKTKGFFSFDYQKKQLSIEPEGPPFAKLFRIIKLDYGKDALFIKLNSEKEKNFGELQFDFLSCNLSGFIKNLTFFKKSIKECLININAKKASIHLKQCFPGLGDFMLESDFKNEVFSITGLNANNETLNIKGKFDIFKKQIIFNKVFSNMYPISLRNPFSVDMKEGFFVGPFSFSVKGGTFWSDSIECKQKKWKGEIYFKNMPLSYLENLPFFSKSKFSASVQIDGDHDFPNIKSNGILDLTGASIAPLEFSLLFNANNKIFDIEAKAKKKSPYNLDIKGQIFFKNENPHINMSAKGFYNLKGLTFLDKDDRALGNLNTEITIKGEIKKPNIDGYLSVTDALYENAEYGSIFSKVKIDSNFHNQSAEIKISANDGLKGALKGKGKIDFNSLPIAINFALLFENFRLIHNDSFLFNTSGEININGTNKEARCDGKITILSAFVDLENLIEPELPSFEQMLNGNVENESRSFLPLLFNIKLSVPPALRIKGLGLNALWQGELNVKGNGTPHLEGNLKFVKGGLRVLERDMYFERGNVFFENGKSPRLNLGVLYDMDEYKIFLDIKGSTDQPSLIFHAIPALPEEQIIGLLLFGEKSEGFPLSVLTDSLKRKDILNVVTSLRTAFGINILELRSAQGERIDGNGTQRGQSVRIGRKIKERIFVAIEQSIQERQQRASIGIGITKRSKIDMGIANDRRSDIGLSWSKHY